MVCSPMKKRVYHGVFSWHFNGNLLHEICLDLHLCINLIVFWLIVVLYISLHFRQKLRWFTAYLLKFALKDAVNLGIFHRKPHHQRHTDTRRTTKTQKCFHESSPSTTVDARRTMKAAKCFHGRQHHRLWLILEETGNLKCFHGRVLNLF